MDIAEASRIIEEIDFLEYQMTLIDDKRDQWADEKREEIYDRMEYLEWVLQLGEQDVIMEKKQIARAHLTLVKGEKE